MFERFTDRARRVVVLAQEEARLLNHNYIGTEHILLGLIHEGEGVAAKALESLDIYPHDPFYSTYLAAAYFFTNRYNRLRQVLPDVDAPTLHDLCPALWEHPRLQPFLPDLSASSDDNPNAQ